LFDISPYYRHGKFESVGSLFLSLTLLATGLSVGAWSYDKMHEVLVAQQFATVNNLDILRDFLSAF
jgi:divalent metal cation (Fe/Co/Zn/Cd) transporter